MGKTIISQARGHGGPRYRVRKQAYIYRIGYPQSSGLGVVLELVASPAHSAPLARILHNHKVYYLPAFTNEIVGQQIDIGSALIKEGNVVMLKDIPTGTKTHNIECVPGDGGKMVRASGTSAIINKKYENGTVGVIMPNKREVRLPGSCRATIGIIAGEGRSLKPFMTAGRKFYAMKSRNKLWPRTSAVKMNAIDHPFGSGRGKRIKPKIAKRNAPAGARVGHIRPRRTGRAK